ncbi:zincin-like metallopeptidase domain-containing protein [Bacillus sp. NPDC060175]|uniref:zincin-like metallopeptidase domain-containing protein n=1 Tax=Bacillus sp. NPDC060175 TaxID=3347061 RepID=UPI00365EA653
MYSTLFHEFIHSTGHSSRLKRDGITSATVNFGSEEYSEEELVAEIGASMLTG